MQKKQTQYKTTTKIIPITTLTKKNTVPYFPLRNFKYYVRFSRVRAFRAKSKDLIIIYNDNAID